MTEEELNKLSMEAKLLLAGGKYWEKKGKRIYLSDIVSKIFDIEVKRYHTGNISEIYINGEKWGNCWVKDFLTLSATLLNAMAFGTANSKNLEVT